MEKINVLIIAPARDSDLATIAAVDPRVNVLDGRGSFDAEYGQTWPQETARRYRLAMDGQDADKARTREAQEKRDTLLREADVICIGFPFPIQLVSRAPRLKWVHQTPAGASNLRFGDIWACSVPVTTSRGYGNSTAHAEWVLAAILMFAKDFPQAFKDKQSGVFERRFYRPRLLAGKTVGIVGLGGIGGEVARLAGALGMRTLGTKRSISSRIANAQGVAELFPPSQVKQLLAESDFVVISAQSTPETDRMIGSEELGVMKPTSYLINVARGELVDEPALIEALRRGAIAGAALDVYEAEFERPPSQELLNLPNVIFMPHVSGGTDVPTHRGIDLFCQNLARFLAGQELVNVIDWERGY